MTFGVSRDKGLFEWSGTSLSAIFAQRWNILNPRMWTMLFDIIRFNQFALDLLSDEVESENDPSTNDRMAPGMDRPQQQQTIGEYLDQENYSEAFRNDYLIPMTAAVWSTAPDKASLEFPAITLIRFMWNHHLLSAVASRPQWMTIPGGSQQYIDAVMADFPRERLHLRSRVKALQNSDDGIVVLLASGEEKLYDHVVLATHGDQALELVQDTASVEEQEILSEFKFSTNTAVLHSDRSVCDLISEFGFQISSINTDCELSAYAVTLYCVVIVELHYYHSIYIGPCFIGLPNILEEPLTAYIYLEVRRYLCNIESHYAARPVPRSGFVDVPSSSVQCCCYSLTESTSQDPKH